MGSGLSQLMDLEDKKCHEDDFIRPVQGAQYISRRVKEYAEVRKATTRCQYGG